MLEPTDRSSHWPWKGDANRNDVVVDGERSPNAAWSYAEPKEAAIEIAGHVAFYPAVTVTR